MTAAWLTLFAILACMAWIAIWARRDTAWRATSIGVLPIAAGAAWFALMVPLGRPAAQLPAGEFVVLGARIDVPTDSSAGAIYVLVDGIADEPRYYRVPYSTRAANDLQNAMDGENGAQVTADGDGGATFHEPPVTADEPKQAETPIIGGM
jgi:hypothetical protein